MSRTGGFCVELVVNESIQSETKYLFTNMSRKKRKAVNVNVRKNSEKAKFSTCLYKGCSVLFREAVKKKNGLFSDIDQKGG